MTTAKASRHRRDVTPRHDQVSREAVVGYSYVLSDVERPFDPSIAIRMCRAARHAPCAANAMRHPPCAANAMRRAPRAMRQSRHAPCAARHARRQSDAPRRSVGSPAARTCARRARARCGSDLAQQPDVSQPASQTARSADPTGSTVTTRVVVKSPREEAPQKRPRRGPEESPREEVCPPKEVCHPRRGVPPEKRCAPRSIDPYVSSVTLRRASLCRQSFSSHLDLDNVRQ